MEEYILKSDLVAEVEKRIKETKSMQPKFDQFWAGQISAFKGVLKILETIEVKDVQEEPVKPTKRGPQTMSDDRRPITDDEIIELFEFYLRKGCKEHGEDSVVISKNGKKIFKATLLDKEE